MAVSLWQCRFALYLERERERESEAVAAAMVGVKVHAAIEATAQYARKEWKEEENLTDLECVL